MLTSEGGILSSSPDLVRELAAAWPVWQPERTDGYRPLPLEQEHIVDAGPLGGRMAVAVVADPSGARAALPVIDDQGWRVAVAGDGVTARLLDALAARGKDQVPGSGFCISSFAPVVAGVGAERALGTDQTNTSVVVDDAVIVKWRTSFEADGLRALTLRRHLAEVGFTAMPPLVGALTWTRPDDMAEVVLADVDAFLPHAEDGWEAFIAELIDCAEGPTDDLALDIPSALGTLAGDLHAALSTPSSVIPDPVQAVGPGAVTSWRDSGLRFLDRALHIEAEDADVVRDRAQALRRDIDGLGAVEATSVRPVHGDLHIGQVIRWRDGLAVIDFDGPPVARPLGPGGEPFERAPAARDVAQLLSSLDLLAVVVDGRTEGRHEAALRTWMQSAREACLRAYRAHAPVGLLDERLLRPFLAEQLCRELVYAADVLPRWRYAPIGALRWRYPGGAS